MAFSGDDIKRFRHPSENSRFILSLFVVVPIALLLLVLVLVTFGILIIYGLILWFFLWVTMRVVLANLRGNAVRISQHNFPDIARMIEDKKAFFGYTKDVEAFAKKYDLENTVYPLRGNFKKAG